MSNKFLMFNLDDDKAKSLGEVISNPTSKKIVNFLAENEASESDIAKALKIPANTVNYNVKRLVDAGLIEPTKKFFWSSKGKKVLSYKVANKLIVISPKTKSGSEIYNKLKGVIPSVIVAGLLSVVVGWYYNIKFYSVSNLDYAKDRVYETASSKGNLVVEAVPSVPQIPINIPAVTPIEISLWFFVGALVALTAYSIWNWKRM